MPVRIKQRHKLFGLVAELRDRTGSFASGWLLHLVLAIVVAALYLRVAPAGYARAMSLPMPARQ